MDVATQVRGDVEMAGSWIHVIKQYAMHRPTSWHCSQQLTGQHTGIAKCIGVSVHTVRSDWLLGVLRKKSEHYT